MPGPTDSLSSVEPMKGVFKKQVLIETKSVGGCHWVTHVCRALIVACGAAYYIHSTYVDTQFHRFYLSIRDSWWFRHDSLEPVAVIICFGLYSLFWDALDKNWEYFKDYKIVKKEPTTALHKDKILAPIFYLGPIILYDIMRPRKVISDVGPSFGSFVANIVGALVMFDFMFFFYHLSLHKVRWMYKYHVKHHMNPVLHSLDTYRLSLFESSCEVGISILTLNLLKADPLTRLVYDIVIVYNLVELHCGWDFPWMMHNVLPGGILNGSVGHDIHHQRGNCNFGKFFSYLDHVFGTHHSKVGGVVVKAIK
eukprot:GFYU01045517.1.p1 GENE.GFYU01045517.1~~GFYU01045517.1.p1  ORF type:complete len:309 (+),score=90.72 GFYU01045517.1:150-1076(+)